MPTYNISKEAIKELEKILKREKKKIDFTNLLINIYQIQHPGAPPPESRDQRRLAREFAGIITTILPNVNLKEIQDISKEEEVGIKTWGPTRADIEEEKKIHAFPGEILKHSTIARIVATILTIKYGLDPQDAKELVHEVYYQYLLGKKHPTPPKNARDLAEMEKYLKEVVKEYNIPGEHAKKIAELFVKVSKAVDDAMPTTIEKELRLAEILAKTPASAIAANTPREIYVDELYPEFESTLKKHSNSIMQIAEELEQISPFKEKRSDRSNPIALSQAKLELLSILNGLEFAGFSEEAKRKAVERLSTRIEGLLEKELTPENLQRLGLYAFAVEMIKRGDFERLREIEKL